MKANTIGDPSAAGRTAKILLHQAWLLYAPMNWPLNTHLQVTCSKLAVYRKPLEYWTSDHGCAELIRQFEGSDHQNLAAAHLVAFHS